MGLRANLLVTWSLLAGAHGAASDGADATKVQANISTVGLSLLASCSADTGGSCRLFGCAASRGPTQCVGGKCVCPTGFCAQDGECFPSSPLQCLTATGGTCRLTGCGSSRGPTQCVGGQCVCKPGDCAFGGKCYPSTDTGGTCGLLGCGATRGPTTCEGGRCLCQAGHLAVAGRCVPQTFGVQQQLPPSGLPPFGQPPVGQPPVGQPPYGQSPTAPTTGTSRRRRGSRRPRVAIDGHPCEYSWHATWPDGTNSFCRTYCCYHRDRRTGLRTTTSFCRVREWTSSGFAEVLRQCRARTTVPVAVSAAPVPLLLATLSEDPVGDEGAEAEDLQGDEPRDLLPLLVLCGLSALAALAAAAAGGRRWRGAGTREQKAPLLES